MNDYYNKNDLDVVKKIFQDSINGKITDSGMINNSERVDRIIRFNEKYKKYFVNQLKDEDITDEVTQMCWQSMFLKKKDCRKMAYWYHMRMPAKDRGQLSWRRLLMMEIRKFTYISSLQK